MMTQLLPRLPEFVFRGTTCNGKGSDAQRAKPHSCPTSANPLKAYYFARFCENTLGIAGVIYIANGKTLTGSKLQAVKSINKLAKIEEEILFWEIKRIDFYKHCDG